MADFFNSIWSLCELLVSVLVESFTAVLDFITFPIQLVSYLPAPIGVGITIGVSILVIKSIGGRL